MVLELGGEEGGALFVEGAVAVLLVGGRAVAEVANHQRRVATRVTDLVVGPQRLFDREQVVRPAALEQHRGGLAGGSDPVALVVGVDLVGDFFVFRGHRFARVDRREPFREVRFGVLAGRRVVAVGGQAVGVETGLVALDLDPDRFVALARRCHFGVEEAAVGLERVDEVRPRPAGVGGLDFHARAAGALPGGVFAVRQADAVLQIGELDALSAAVGDPGDADRRAA